jgi:protein NEDD1
MLAVASSAGITLLPTSLAKKLPSHVALSIETQTGAVAAAWSPDHTFLLFAQGRAIHRAAADLSSASELIHEDEGGDVVSHIVCPTPSTAIYSAGRRITLITHTPFRVDFSIDGKHTITSLSLSLDVSTLIYTTSASAHTLSLATKASATLRGLALSDGAQILGCAVHPHTRGRAILAAGRSLLVYDVNRPSAPLKIIGAGGSEPLVFVTCSPFSRTLVAAGTSSGNVILIDLEKDKRSAIFPSHGLCTSLTNV